MRSSWHKKGVHQRQLLKAFDALEQLVCHSRQAAGPLGGPQYVQIKQGSQLPLAHDVSALASTRTQTAITCSKSIDASWLQLQHRCAPGH
jgi:hypothetical protein